MLAQLQISNYVIVESLDLEFDRGMSVLSGETGAGKSILLGALGLALGDRADNAMVLPGCARAEISASFMINTYPQLQQWLTEQELDSDDDCIIRRTISSEGRSRGYINGQPVPLTTLKAVGEQLVELHGQHAHHSLLKPETQRQLLDSYAEHLLDIEQLAILFKQRKALQQQLDQLVNQQQDQSEREALLRFQIDELEKLNLQPGEWETLEQDHSRISNIQTLKEGCYTIQSLLDDENGDSINNQLNQAQREISAITILDSSLEPIATMLDEASIQINEASSQLRHYIDQLDIDPQQLQQIEEKISAAFTLARKHRIAPEELPQQLLLLQQHLTEIDSADERIASLQQQLSDHNHQFEQLKNQVSKQRQQAASKLQQEISANMRELGIDEGELNIQINPGPDTIHGGDEITFEIRTNPGQPFRPLHKIASGGELSRISLAIQVILATRAAIPTLIFDEVDVGIGGKTADMVGRALRKLGNDCQVLCVTHQPQVAAQAHHHFQILKERNADASRTHVIKLDHQARVAEIARMSGGITITAQTMHHAEQMMKNVQN